MKVAYNIPIQCFFFLNRDEAGCSSKKDSDTALLMMLILFVLVLFTGWRKSMHFCLPVPFYSKTITFWSAITNVKAGFLSRVRGEKESELMHPEVNLRAAQKMSLEGPGM